MRRSHRFLLVTAAACLAAGLLQAATGPTASSYLRFLEVQRNGSGGVTGLNGATAVTVSPDGKHAYAAGELDDALAVFDRDSASGALTFVEMQKQAVAGVDGLTGAHGVVVSPDGAHVYVASKVADALAVFSRDGAHVYAAGSLGNAVAVFGRDAASGKLAFVEAQHEGQNGVVGLSGARGVAVAPDGANVYVAGSSDDALVVFGRNPETGALT